MKKREFLKLAAFTPIAFMLGKVLGIDDNRGVKSKWYDGDKLGVEPRLRTLSAIETSEAPFNCVDVDPQDFINGALYVPAPPMEDYVRIVFTIDDDMIVGKRVE